MSSFSLKHIFIVLFSICQLTSIYGQRNAKKPNLSQIFNKAMDLAEDGDYNGAIEKFKIITKNDPKHLDALFNMGLCYLNTSNSADTAVICFQDGLDQLNSEDNKGYIGNEFRFSMAEAYQVLLKPNKALSLYKEILDHSSDQDSSVLSQINREIEICKNAAFFISNPIEITIENLGTNVNSMYDDHSPIVAVDEKSLIFTSRRKWIKVPLLRDGQYAEKIYNVSLDKNNWEAAKVLQIFFDQYEHEAAVSISPDGRKIILFRNDNEGSSLYWTKFSNEKWSEPKKFPAPINSEFKETHGCISADMSTIYFTSNRPGGYGGLDIYMCSKEENGNWGKAINLGPEINSPLDEETPQIHYDGKTLYFSSEGHNTMGKLDVFYSTLQSNKKWGTPVNMGFPINTPDDDFFFTPTINKSHAYYASSRFADNYGGSDIYLVKFKENTSSQLAVVEGTIDNSLGDNYARTRVLVTRTDNKELIGNYRPNSDDGSYMLFLEVGYEYEIKEENDIKEITKYINSSPEMSYAQMKKAIPFTSIAMDAPLIRVDTLHQIANNSAIALPDTSTIKITNLSLPTNTERSIKTSEDNGYTIQLMALKKRPLRNLKFFTKKGITDVYVHTCTDGFTRYTTGNFTTYDQTLEAKKSLINSGLFSDLWIRPNRDLSQLRKDQH